MLETGYAVDDQTLDPTPLNRFQQPMGKLIQDLLAHRVPDHLNLAPLFRRGKTNPHCLGLQAQAVRGFVAAK